MPMPTTNTKGDLLSFTAHPGVRVFDSDWSGDPEYPAGGVVLQEYGTGAGGKIVELWFPTEAEAEEEIRRRGPRDATYSVQTSAQRHAEYFG